MNEPQDIQIDNWHLKVRIPDGAGPHPVIFMIHGWTGDHNSMWVFAPRMPRNAFLIAPRAPYVSKHPEIGGYSWVEERTEAFSPLKNFQPALNLFDDLVLKISKEFSANSDSFKMVGFSQGAAFCLAYSIKNPARISKLAMLAGFLPAESEDAINERLQGLPVFIAHGLTDETVPIQMAHDARSTLQAAGAQVRYCESDTAHKLGANCAKELQDFFAT